MLDLLLLLLLKGPAFHHHDSRGSVCLIFESVSLLLSVSFLEGLFDLLRDFFISSEPGGSSPSVE